MYLVVVCLNLYYSIINFTFKTNDTLISEKRARSAKSYAIRRNSTCCVIQLAATVFLSFKFLTDTRVRYIQEN